MWSGKTHTHIWKLTYWSTWRHRMCSTRHHPAYVGCLSDLNYNEMATAGRKRREDIWVNFTFDIKTNKTLCKPCGAEIAGKNTKFLLILFCQLTSVGVLLHNWNIIAQGFSKSGLRIRTGREFNPDPPPLYISSALVSLRPPLGTHTHARTRAHEPVLQCLQTLL